MTEYNGSCPTDLMQLGRFFSRSPNQQYSSPSQNRSLDSFFQLVDCPSGGKSFKEIQAHANVDICSDFVYLGSGLSKRMISSKTVLAYESVQNHNDGANFLFADGAIMFLPKDKALELIAKLERGDNELSKRVTSEQALDSRGPATFPIAK